MASASPDTLPAIPMSDLTQIKERIAERSYTRATRTKGEFADITRGYILGVSETLALIQLTSDFDVDGFAIYPTETLKVNPQSDRDRYYDQIMTWELKKNPICPFEIDLRNWSSLIASLKCNSLPIIVECEEPHLDFFCIGFIEGVDEDGVFLYYVSPDGYQDKDLTFTAFKDITKVTFGDRYSTVLAKYVRQS